MKRIQVFLYIISFGYWMCYVLQCFVVQVMHQRQFHTSLKQLAINIRLHSWGGGTKIHLLRNIKQLNQ